MDTVKLEVMTLQNPRWVEFCARLAEQLHFRQVNGHDKWDCDGTTDKPVARDLLETMGFDVAKSFAYFEEWGGYCDCEILFNVDC